MNKRAMISMPLAGRTDEDIIKHREKAIKALTDMGYDVVYSGHDSALYRKANMDANGVVQVPLYYLANGLQEMARCHVVYFCKGWEKARGCKIERMAAEAYGLEIIEE